MSDPADSDAVEHHRWEVSEHKRCVHEAAVRLDAARILIEGIEGVDPETDASVNLAQRRVLDALETLAKMQHTTATDQP